MKIVFVHAFLLYSLTTAKLCCCLPSTSPSLSLSLSTYTHTHTKTRAAHTKLQNTRSWLQFILVAFSDNYETFWKTVLIKNTKPDTLNTHTRSSDKIPFVIKLFLLFFLRLLCLWLFGYSFTLATAAAAAFFGVASCCCCVVPGLTFDLIWFCSLFFCCLLQLVTEN